MSWCTSCPGCCSTHTSTASTALESRHAPKRIPAHCFRSGLLKRRGQKRLRHLYLPSINLFRLCDSFGG